MNNRPIEEEIHHWFITHHKTLSAAESCTGGSLAAQLTRLPGASQYFLGSLVTYSNDLKTNVLKVPKKLLEQYGAVSSEAVEAMAKGILNLTGSDFAVAVSGIAGPSGGSIEKPVGTIWGRIANKDSILHAWQFHVVGSREQVIHGSVETILKELLYRCWESDLQSSDKR